MMIRDTDNLTAELAAVWDEMFEAVGSIMKAAEQVDALATSLPDALGQDISAATVRIFEACAFQDIAGQRIAKVVGALAYADRNAPVPDIVLVDIEEPKPANDESHLLNGPQLPGRILSQEAIDELLALAAQTA